MFSHNKKNNENINIIEKRNEINEINIIKRALDNNTHEVLTDKNLKRITSWRKSKKKFMKNLKYNLLTLGILHLISLYYPNLYIKLYCNPWPAKECDFFLVENIYGQFSLCKKIYKKSNNNKNLLFSGSTKQNIISSINEISSDLNYIKNLTYSFIYKSVTYEYNEETNEIIPVYINISKISNKKILNYFNEGLISENLMKKYKERYGLNQYFINIKLPLIYFLKHEFPSFILVLIIGIIEFSVLNDYMSLIIKSFVIFAIFIIQFLTIKKLIFNNYKNEYTLDGNQNIIKVKRKYLLNDNNRFYAEIKNIELIPGDIIYLQRNDFVPCDCILIEGECLVNEFDLSGKNDIIKKTSLKNNNEEFNYRYNSINILLHGMKIYKIFTKFNDRYILALCINTGPNTYKANQYSNILYFLERKIDYNRVYKFFGNRKKIIFIYIIISFFLSIILSALYFSQLKIQLEKGKVHFSLYKLIIKYFCKSMMVVYFITHNIMIFVNLYRLKNKNIFCFDKSRLINSGKINTIFLNKSIFLSQNSFEINSYHPVYSVTNKTNKYLSFRNYLKNQCKEMNIQLLNYYKQYLEQKQSNENNIKLNKSQLFNAFNKKTDKYLALFIECLLCCNNIEKYNIELFGSVIETTLFDDMKWEIKTYDYIYDNKAQYDKNYEYNYSYSNYINSSISYKDDQFNLIENKIIDVYPKNYYKIKESSKLQMKVFQQTKIIKIDNNNNISKEDISKNESLLYNKFFDNLNESYKNQTHAYNVNINRISQDISKFHIDSYKLRIYKKFLKNGTFKSSVIVYNFMTKELRFMIKGMPEEIIDKCDINTIPENLINTFSIYRKNGFVIVACASKLINMNDFNDLNDLEYYMNDLTFIGFFLLKSKIEIKAKNSIKELKDYNCSLAIISGDNECNCLCTGFNYDIIDKKNIFVLDKEDKGNNITIRKIYNHKNNTEGNVESKYNNNSSDKISKTTSRINNKMFSLTNINQKINDNSSLLSSKSKNDYKNSNKQKFANKINKMEKLKEKNIFLSPKIKIKLEEKQIIRNKRKMTELPINRSLSENINNLQNSEISNFYKNEKQIKLNSTFKNKEYKINYDYKDLKDNNCKNYKYNDLTQSKKIPDFEKIYYYYGIFNDYEELKNNCIYCTSGKAFNFLYINKNNKQCKKLLEQIYKNSKIFFNMSSFDKTLLVDFYREHKNIYICNIGKTDNDIDSLFASNVGINFNKPKNLNTILFHFYNSNNDLLCIKKIIMEGRVLYENTVILELVSFVCTIVLNSFIICCLIRNTDIIEEELQFLEIEFLILSISSFTGESKKNLIIIPLAKNAKLLKLYYIFQMIGILIIKFLSVLLFSLSYHSDYRITIERRNIIFINYFFVLCIEFIICIIFALNDISIYRKSPFSNAFLRIFTIFVILYMIILISLNSSNFHYDFLRITSFEFSELLNDSFSDNNRIYLLIACLFDFIISILYSKLIYLIFDKISKNINPIKDN